MPIEFYCPGCGNLMRTPDETAGRKGRCPTCQLKVQIPASSVTSNSSESAVPRTAMAAIPKAKGPEPIRFDCGSCGKTLSIAAANAGKKGQCPHCGKLMSIPLKSLPAGERWKGTPKQRSTSSPAQTSKPSPAQPSKPSPVKPSAPVSTPQPALTKAGGEKIEFHCSSCHEVVRVGVAAAGKKGQCPRCKAVVEIPRASTSVSGLQPIPSDKPTSPRPQRTSAEPVRGLTPLGSVGSTIPDGNPFGSDPFGAYSAPAPALAVSRRPRTGARTGPEIATMICGGCLIFYSVAQIVLVVLSLFFRGVMAFAVMDDFRKLEEDQAYVGGMFALGVLATVLGGVAMLVILAGGIQMIRLKVWGLCLAACILAMLPCTFNCFCLFGMPFGIWGIVMLSLNPVRSAFR